MENQSQSNQKRIKIMLSAADVSGDVNGAWLCRALLKQNPKLEIFGFGGPKMRREGCDIEKNLRPYGFRGIPLSRELWKKILQPWTQKKEVNAIIDKMLDREPHVVVLLSSYAWNKKIAKRIKERGSLLEKEKKNPPLVIYYFLPDLWIYPFQLPDWWIFRPLWKKPRDLFKYSSYLVANMRFERNFYEELRNKISLNEGEKAKVVYYGHPILDRLKESESLIKEKASSKIKTIALLPGSRRDEVKNMLPIMIDAASKILENKDIKDKFSIKFLVSDAAAFLLEDIREILVEELKKISNPKGKRPSITIEEADKTPMLVTLRKCDLIILASGTASMEVLCLKKPMVVIYKLNLPTLLVYVPVIFLRNLTFRLQIFRVPIFSLANKIIEESKVIKTAKRKYFPELFQTSLSKRIAEEAVKLLNDENWVEENKEIIKQAIKDQLVEKDELGEEISALKAIADFILKEARKYINEDEKAKQSFSDDLQESISDYEKKLINKANSQKMIMLELSDEGKNPGPSIQECIDYALKEKLIEKQDSEYIVPERISHVLENEKLKEVKDNWERLIKLSFAYLDKKIASFKEIIAQLEINLLDLIGLSTELDIIADSLIKKETGKRPLKLKRHVLLIVLAVKIVSEAKKNGLIEVDEKGIFKLLEAK